MPSTTRNMPRSASMWNASSLLRRTRPGSLAPAHLSFVLTMRRASKFKEHHVRQTDSGLCRDGCFQVAVAFFSVREIHAGGNFFAVDGGAQPAQVFQKKLAALRVAPQPEMFARNVR